MSYYNGFNYEEFYEFIIDFLEEDQTPEGKAATSALFDWWNRYVPDSRSVFTITNASQTCVSTVCCYPCGLIYIGKAVVTCSRTTAASSTLILLIHPVRVQLE